MTTKTQTDRAVTAILVIAVVIAISAGGAWAAAPTVDTERVDTASKSDVRGGTVIENFAPVRGEHSVLQAEYDSTNPGVRILDEDGDIITTYVAEDMEQTYADANSSTYYYNVSIHHAVWRGVEIAPGEEVNVTVQLLNNTRAGTPDTTNLTVVLEGSNCRTVRLADDSAADSAFSVARGGITIPVLGHFGGDVSSTYEASKAPINGSNSTVEIHYANETAISSLSTATSELNTGDWSKRIVVQTDDGPIRTYVDGAPNDVSNATTYAVYDTSRNELLIHTGEEYDGVSEISGLSVTANAGFLDRLGAYGLTIGDRTIDVPGR